MITQAEHALLDVTGPGCIGIRPFPVPSVPKVHALDFGSNFAAIVTQMNVILHSDPTAKILVPTPSPRTF
jgi:hypothetical protein